MSTRIIVALIAIPIILIPIYIGGIWGVLLLLTLGLLAGWEFFYMMRVGGYHPARWLGMIWLAAISLSFWQPDLLPLSYVLAIGLIGTMTYSLFEKERPADTWFATSTGAIYLGVTLGMGMALRLLPNGLWWLLFALLITWANDSAAYFSGVSLGRHKLWPRLSPKKTWEGTIGGWVAAALAAALLAWLFPIPLAPAPALLVGLTAGMLALVGDLSISMLKRQVGVKDSGWHLPGHGGKLDRMDSLLFVVPFIYMVVAAFSL